MLLPVSAGCGGCAGVSDALSEAGGPIIAKLRYALTQQHTD